MSKWIVVGATSAIAVSVSRLLAARGVTLGLMARDQGKLDILRQDLLARGASRVETAVWDALDESDTPTAISRMIERLDGLDGMLVAHGTLSDQVRCQNDWSYARSEWVANALSVSVICSVAANYMEQRRAGSLVVISSVAGDRGRQSNYAYGAAKAMVTTFLQGLRNRLAPAGVQVLTVKPGFVDTPMTAHLPKGGPLWASADDVAQVILRGIDGRRDVIYTPWFWRYIMLIIQHIPEVVFKRLKL